jgi:hypothetical protein
MNGRFNTGWQMKLNRCSDGGAQERGDAHGGRVGAPPNFREIQGGRGDVGVPSIGVPVSKIIKIKIIMIKSQQ